MREFLKSKYHSTVIQMQNCAQYTSIRLLGTTGLFTICDPQSTCAKVARDIVTLVARKQNTPHQNLRIRDEIMTLLDHDKLLTHFQCNVLALLTLQEAVRLLVVGASDSSQLLFLQDIQIDLRQNYSETPVCNPCSTMDYYLHAAPPADNNRGAEPEEVPILDLLVPKHVGQGMKYLEALRKHSTNNGSTHRGPPPHRPPA